jgi:hypothetical protein
MKQRLLTDLDEAELIALWAGRGSLSGEQWHRLWALICRVLNRCHPSVLQSLPDTKEDYISEFFLQKVLHTKDRQQHLASAAALATFFQRYLIDVYRHRSVQSEIHVDDEATLDALSTSGDDDCASETATLGHSPDVAASRTELLASALTFFQTLAYADQLYLALHACDGDGEPLSALAKRYQIASYHYKAGQLGITRRKDDLPATYDQTKIGRWLTKDLGLKMSAEFADDVTDAFESLCHAAALWRRHRFQEV